MRDRKLLIIGALPMILLIPGFTVPSHAGDRDHANGFFMRLSAGGGGVAMDKDLGGADWNLSGAASNLSIAIGGIVSSNLAVHATIFAWRVTNPKVDVLDYSGRPNFDAALGALGAGVTYYIMPANVYLSASVGLGVLSFDGPDIAGGSHSGAATDLNIGKEWWVGSNWGLGVAGTVGFHTVPDGDTDANWRGANIGVRFTATLN